MRRAARGDHTDLWICAALFALTFAVFAQVANHQFINIDDDQFLYGNAVVKTGVNPPSFTWALTSTQLGWYPLTWMSHALDAQLWGMNPRGHLLTQVLLHFLSTIVLFFALRRMTLEPLPSAFVSALFAIHPMHVESVAWAAERKDTLSTLFILLALFVYASDVRAREWKVAALFAASLMSKQMYVTFPLLLVVLDWWPLRRGLRIRDKLPLVVLSALGAWMAILGQRSLHAVQSLEAVSITTRAANVIAGYATYLQKLVWPVRMAMPYPMTPVSGGRLAAGLALLVSISAIAVLMRKRAPWLLVGWSWFLVTLLPVIGIVQIGPQPVADRYTYFSYIGLFLAFVWSARALIPARVAAAAGFAVVTVFAGIAWKQTSYWRDSVTLLRHTVAVTPPNAFAEYGLAQALQMTVPDEAVVHAERSMALLEAEHRRNPAAPLPDWYPQTFVARATARLKKASTLPPEQRGALIDTAESDLRRALALDPKTPHAANNLGFALAMRQQADPHRLAAEAAMKRGFALLQQSRFEDAEQAFAEAAAHAPAAPEPLVYRGLCLGQLKRNREAADAFERAASINEPLSNELVTKALNLRPGASNLRQLVVQLRTGSPGHP